MSDTHIGPPGEPDIIDGKPAPRDLLFTCTPETFDQVSADAVAAARRGDLATVYLTEGIYDLRKVRKFFVLEDGPHEVQP